MKNRLLILTIIIAIMALTLVACQAKSVTKNNDASTAEVLEQSQNGDIVQSTPIPTVPAIPTTPAAPTAAMIPTIPPLEENTNDISDESLYIMNTPPFGYYLSDNTVKTESTPLSLKMRLKEPNQITDDDAWFTDNDLDRDTFQVPNFYQNISGNLLPSEIDTTWNDLIITSAFYDDTYIYCTYGLDFSQGYLLKIYDAESLNVVYFLDFSSYRYSPDYVEADYDFIQQKINWAMIKDNVLYVSHSHNTYAKSSNNMNAYITAIDLSDMSILWRSDALISNACNFYIIGDIILSGYGFTDEDDFLYELDRNTGEVIKSIPLVTAASYIRYKDNALYIRTYNTNYIFDIVL